MKERCLIGCGCGKSKKSRSQRLKAQKIQSKNRKIMKKQRATLLASPFGQKTAICLSCPQSTQTKNERKRGLRVCHKTNRLISNLVKDDKFICPIGRWDGIKS